MVQDIYEGSVTVVRCAVRVTDGFKVAVQGLAFSPFLVVVDGLMDEIRQESPWTMMFADDIVT